MAGIGCGTYVYLPHPVFYSAVFSTFLISFFKSFKNLQSTLLYISIFLCGWISANQDAVHPAIQGEHYMQCECKEILGQGGYIVKASAQLFYLPSSDSTTFIPGDSLSFNCKIYPLHTFNTEGAFHYHQYLKQKNVHFRLFPYSPLEKSGHSRTLLTFFQRLRHKMLHKMDKLISNPTYRALLEALCLGYKNDLNTTTKSLFSSTGTIHLLAVSGLHTGAVYVLITFIFGIFGIRKPLPRLLIIPLLGAYACLTGLSPSVLRSAILLSFLLIGQAFDKNYTPLNSVAASAFLTLVVLPSNLYSVSFQMSYAAYTGILVFFPPLNRFTRKLPNLFSRLCSLIWLSVAAQLATLPLCLYYFHTISLNSFLINIVAIPLTTLLLYTTLLLLLLPLTLGLKLIFLTDFLCTLLFAGLQHFTAINWQWENCYPPLLHLFFAYFTLLSFLWLSKKRKRKIFYFSGISLTLWLIYACSYNLHLQSKREVILFHCYGKSCILLNHTGNYSFLKNDLDSSEWKYIRPYIQKNRLSFLPVNEGLLAEDFTYFQHTLSFRDIQIRLVNAGFQADTLSGILLITGNVSPQKLLKNKDFPLQAIYLDASNSFFCIREWEKYCEKHQIPLQKTTESGCIRIPLKSKTSSKRRMDRKANIRKENVIKPNKKTAGKTLK